MPIWPDVEGEYAGSDMGMVPTSAGLMWNPHPLELFGLWVDQLANGKFGVWVGTYVCVRGMLINGKMLFNRVQNAVIVERAGERYEVLALLLAPNGDVLEVRQEKEKKEVTKLNS